MKTKHYIAIILLIFGFLFVTYCISTYEVMEAYLASWRSFCLCSKNLTIGIMYPGVFLWFLYSGLSLYARHLLFGFGSLFGILLLVLSMLCFMNHPGVLMLRWMSFLLLRYSLFFRRSFKFLFITSNSILSFSFCGKILNIGGWPFFLDFRGFFRLLWFFSSYMSVIWFSRKSWNQIVIQKPENRRKLSFFFEKLKISL